MLHLSHFRAHGDSDSVNRAGVKYRVPGAAHALADAAGAEQCSRATGGADHSLGFENVYLVFPHAKTAGSGNFIWVIGISDEMADEYPLVQVFFAQGSLGSLGDDGLDGLASGFMLMLCLSAAFLGSGSFSQVNLLLAVLLLVFLVYNQRPAKVFMGDAGSLFLGFYVAVLPLLYQDLGVPTSSTLNITPFLILVFFLVADTTRVFFTRLLSGKSPMAADTIHLHHLVIQRSGSYLVTLSMIFFVIMIFFMN